MPSTSWGIWYPASTDSTRLWEHFQQLAESVNVTVIPPIFSSRFQSVNLTRTPSTYEPIPFDTDSGTQGITWNGSGWVVETAGRYQINGSLKWDSVTPSQYIAVYQNGANIRRVEPNADEQIIQVAAGATCEVGDVIEVRSWTNPDNFLIGNSIGVTSTWGDISYGGRALGV